MIQETGREFTAKDQWTLRGLGGEVLGSLDPETVRVNEMVKDSPCREPFILY